MDRHPVLKRHIFSLYNITPFLKVPLGVGVTQAEPTHEIALTQRLFKFSARCLDYDFIHIENSDYKKILIP